MYLKFLFTVFILLVSNLVLVHSLSEVLKFLTKYKKCFHQKYPMGCLKEKVLIALNETIQDDRPIVIGFVEIQKNPEFFRDYNNSMNNYTEKSTLPEEATARSLTDTLMQKLEEFFRSRTLKVNLANAFQGRKGGGGGGGGGGGVGGGGKKGGGGMAMVCAGMAAMMGTMVMGKMAMMAGSAMMMAKLSLLMSLIMILKKMQMGGGGGEEKHIVYADSGGHSHGGGGGGYGGGGGGGYGGGGGWHRSLEDPHNIIYKGQWGPSSTENGSGL